MAQPHCAAVASTADDIRRTVPRCHEADPGVPTSYAAWVLRQLLIVEKRSAFVESAAEGVKTSSMAAKDVFHKYREHRILFRSIDRKDTLLLLRVTSKRGASDEDRIDRSPGSLAINKIKDINEVKFQHLLNVSMGSPSGQTTLPCGTDSWTAEEVLRQ